MRYEVIDHVHDEEGIKGVIVRVGDVFTKQDYYGVTFSSFVCGDDGEYTATVHGKQFVNSVQARVWVEEQERKNDSER